MYLYGNGCRETCSDVVDRFRINKNQVKMIFVNETLIQIDGQDYWLWIAYEPNIDLCLMVHICQEKELYSYVINSSRNYERDLAENSYLQMVLDGI
jgi:hypothetical protein